ncbi:Chemotaxis response regulator containing a CheY-like receiver domain and a methylesterase domain [Mesorhizobium plurifarium]|uniref:protein-glutamate methylesterase n=1 Tax=Mesorhizobium plurifarium TaxID=69974 RepID=A0A090GAW3_MESPL|nr:Chemotaxis response regulator containing a CheY-like receiver domain and a methylesterase domain [Mesorhizobium plurifarium]
MPAEAIDPVLVDWDQIDRVKASVCLIMHDVRVDSLAPYFVALGASGIEGLHDLRHLVQSLPAGLNAVVLAVLHRPSNRVSYLRDILARCSELPVVIAKEGDTFRAGTCYIGEPAAHLSLAERSRIHLIEGAHNQFRNRTVDLLFTSVAAHAGSRAIGVVLRGALGDGSRGLADIHLAGGLTMVVGEQGQIPAGMPRNATNYDGPIDFVGTVDEIAEEISRIAGVCSSHVQEPADSLPA